MDFGWSNFKIGQKMANGQLLFLALLYNEKTFDGLKLFYELFVFTDCSIRVFYHCRSVWFWQELPVISYCHLPH